MSRLAQLERDNVALQEEVLLVRRQLRDVQLGRARNEELEAAIRDLQAQVELAVVELKNVRAEQREAENMRRKEGNAEQRSETAASTTVPPKAPPVFDLDQLLS